MISPSSIRPLDRFRANDQGVTAIEFALVAPMLLLFVLGITEVGLLVAGQQVLEDAVFVGSRTSKTGYVASKAGSTQASTITAAIKKAAGSYLDPSKITVTSKAYPDYASIDPEPFTDTNKNGVHDASEAYTDVNKNGKYDNGAGTAGYGTSSQIVVFTATYPWTMRTPLIGQFFGKNGTYTLTARAVVKNEPY